MVRIQYKYQYNININRKEWRIIYTYVLHPSLYISFLHFPQWWWTALNLNHLSVSHFHEHWRILLIPLKVHTCLSPFLFVSGSPPGQQGALWQKQQSQHPERGSPKELFRFGPSFPASFAHYHRHSSAFVSSSWRSRETRHCRTIARNCWSTRRSMGASRSVSGCSVTEKEAWSLCSSLISSLSLGIPKEPDFLIIIISCQRGRGRGVGAKSLYFSI